VLLDDVAQTSEALSATPSRRGKVDLLAECLRGADPDEIPIVVAYLAGRLPHEPIGIGWRSLTTRPAPAASGTLDVRDVDAALRLVGAASGAGSRAVRRETLRGLLERATEREQRFLARLLTGELRQGALEGAMVDAVARAFGVPVADVRRALMRSSDLGRVATLAARSGAEGLAAVRLTPLEPVQPMLATPAAGLAEALARIERPVVEWKLDGARLQLHRAGAEVRAFTRTGADVTGRVPELVESVASLPVDAVVLDAEAIALRPDGQPHPFRVSMSRFGSTTRVDELRRETPLTCFVFDCLQAEGVDLLDHPASERLGALDRIVPPEMRVPRLAPTVPADAETFLHEALAAGHEGVMVKSLEAPYEAGRRGGAWLKVKPATTLDLVVLAAEWGHGRRTGRLSNLHLGARDPAGGFVMLGKTFKGLTDEMLAWQTERLLDLEVRREGHVVQVRPELVVEVAFEGIQASTRYPGGVALRFARVKGYRPDKPAAEADTLDTVRSVEA
jgi:DNA ligase-1